MNLKVQCLCCSVELTSTTKVQTCGCPNMMTVQNDTVSAKDISQVKLLEKMYTSEEDVFIEEEEMAKRIMRDWQMERSMREITKFNYESSMHQGVEVLRFV